MTHTLPRKLRPGFDQLSDDAFIRQKELLNSGLAPFSASTLWRKCRRSSEQQYPAPVKISGSITAWRVGDIRLWLADPAGYALRPIAKATALGKTSGKEGAAK